MIGTTWYEIQHNGTIGRMVVKDEDGYLHFVWMNGLDCGVTIRNVYYNYIDPLGIQGWPGVGYPVESSVRAGYTTLDVGFDGRAFPCFHWTNTPGGLYSTATGTDFFPHTGTFIVYQAPSVPGVDEVIWPRLQFDNNQKLQIISTETVPNAGDPQRHYWTMGTYDPVTYSISYDPYDEMTWTMTIAADVATSEVSDKCAYAWTYPLDPAFPSPGGDYSQCDNDIWVLIDEDGVDPDWNQAINVTSFLPPDYTWLPDTLIANMDTLRAYTDLNVFIDQDDYLHVTFTTPSYFAIQGTRYWHASIIWHWSEQYPDEFHMIHNAFDDWWWNFVDCGAWNMKAQRPSLSQDPSTGYLYCAYQVYDCDTMALNWEGKPSGEIYLSVSMDGGQSWALSTNITQTITPNGAPPGENLSEVCPSMAKLVDGECHILYVLDRDPQPAPPWTLNEVIYHNVPVDLIPTTPLVQQTVPFHQLMQPSTSPYIAVNSMSTTVFPAEGGVLAFNVVCWEHMIGPATGDVWADVTLPNGVTVGPILGPVLDIIYDWSIIRNLSLNVPDRAPAGNYVLNAYWGDYPSVIAENYLRFYKSNTVGNGRDIYTGNNGEWLEMPLDSGEEVTEASVICVNRPNPFNLSTTFSFDLPEATHVKLIVYNLLGQVVATLLDGMRDVGSHDVTFDASNLASGIYLYRLTAGSNNISGKMILVK